jgi:hypothetical protein
MAISPINAAPPAIYQIVFLPFSPFVAPSPASPAAATSSVAGSKGGISFSGATASPGTGVSAAAGVSVTAGFVAGSTGTVSAPSLAAEAALSAAIHIELEKGTNINVINNINTPTFPVKENSLLFIEKFSLQESSVLNSNGIGQKL